MDIHIRPWQEVFIRRIEYLRVMQRKNKVATACGFYTRKKMKDVLGWPK